MKRWFFAFLDSETGVSPTDATKFYTQKMFRRLFICPFIFYFPVMRQIMLNRDFQNPEVNRRTCIYADVWLVTEFDFRPTTEIYNLGIDEIRVVLLER